MSAPSFNVGDAVAFSSMYCGTYRVKIGRILRVPVSGDARTPAGRFQVRVTGAYVAKGKEEIGTAKQAMRLSFASICMAVPSSLREPTAAELKVVA